MYKRKSRTFAIYRLTISMTKLMVIIRTELNRVYLAIVALTMVELKNVLKC